MQFPGDAHAQCGRNYTADGDNPHKEVRFAVDSPLEGGVSCELVSEIEFASLAK